MQHGTADRMVMQHGTADRMVMQHGTADRHYKRAAAHHQYIARTSQRNIIQEQRAAHKCTRASGGSSHLYKGKWGQVISYRASHAISHLPYPAKPGAQALKKTPTGSAPAMGRSQQHHCTAPHSTSAQLPYLLACLGLALTTCTCCLTAGLYGGVAWLPGYVARLAYQVLSSSLAYQVLSSSLAYQVLSSSLMSSSVL
jgi:hypothetical protein